VTFKDEFFNLILRFTPDLLFPQEQEGWHVATLPNKVSQHATLTPAHMFELRAPAATWMFAMMIQVRPKLCRRIRHGCHCFSFFLPLPWFYRFTQKTLVGHLSIFPAVLQRLSHFFYSQGDAEKGVGFFLLFKR